MLNRAAVEVPTAEWTFDQLLEAALKIKESAPNPDEVWGLFRRTRSQETGWIVRSFGGNQVTADPLTRISTTRTPSRPTSTSTMASGPTGSYRRRMRWNNGAGHLVAFASGLVGIMYSLNDEAFVFSEVVGDDAEWTMAPTPAAWTGASSSSADRASRFPRPPRFPIFRMKP